MPKPLALALLALLVAAGPARAGGEARVRALAEAALAAQFPADAHRLEVRVTRFSASDGALDRDGLAVQLPADGALPRAHTRADLVLDGRGVGHAFLYVAHWDSVAVPHQAVPRDAPVVPGALDLAWIETTRFTGQPLTAAALRALGPDVFAVRPLRAGRALRAGDLRPPFAAETGEALTVTYRGAAFALTLTAHAREPGHVGETVRAYAASTGATYRVRLTAPGTAEWVETL